MNQNDDAEPEMQPAHEGYYSGLITTGLIMLLINAILVIIVLL